MATKKTKVEIYGDSSKYERSMRNVQLASKRTSQTLTSHWKGVTAALGGVLAAAASLYGAVKLGGTFLEAAKTSENFRVRLEVLLGSVEEGNRLFQEMEIYAGRVPFEFEKVMGSATMLSGVMKGGVDEIKTWMPMIGDLAAAAGLGIDKTTEQVIRMYSAGAASADLFRERGILAMLGFQAGVSYSAEETRKKLMESWNAAGSQFRGATEKLATTWDGMMSMISDKWYQFRNLIMEAGVYDELKKQLSEINDRFGRWIKNNDDIIKQKVPEYIEKIKSAITKMVDIYNALPDGVIGAAGVGLLGTILFGPQAGVLLGVLTYATGRLATLYGILSDIYKMSVKKPPQSQIQPPGKGFEAGILSYLRPVEPENPRAVKTTPAPATGETAVLGFETTGQRLLGMATSVLPAAMNGDEDLLAREYRLNRLQEIEEENIAKRAEFARKYAALGKSTYELEIENVNTMAEAWRQAGADQLDVARWTSQRIQEIKRSETIAVQQMYADMAGQVANTFLQISQAGGKQSIAAFRIYQALAISEAIIAANLAAAKVLGQTGMFGIPLSAMVYGQAMLNVAMIAAATPPSYDQGGISTSPGIYYSGVPEAHIPLEKGSVPVVIEREKQEINLINITDPSVIDQYLASSRGQDAIINVISSKASSVRRVLR
ncbi:MAG: hypothetical protein JXB42_01710 [Deltaproteobacteria bacterium]|nr:hypothetical protein [Deltaproteobacteria bacterium]